MNRAVSLSTERTQQIAAYVDAAREAAHDLDALGKMLSAFGDKSDGDTFAVGRYLSKELERLSSALYEWPTFIDDLCLVSVEEQEGDRQ